MNEAIEAWKRRMEEARKENGDWRTPYRELMRAVYAQDVLFFALSRSGFDPENGTSTPLVSTKDFGGRPALYVFSGIETAEAWMKHYRHVTDDGRYGLIGAVEKEPSGFLSVFPIALRMGAEMIMLDEGGDYVGMGLRQFLEGNGVDPERAELPLSKEETDALLSGKDAPALRFARIPAIPLKKD